MWPEETMSTLQLPVPEEYSNEGDIELWINELENYMMAASGHLPNERKKAILLACIGKQGILVINNFQETQRSNYRSLVESLKDHYKEVTNVIVGRHIINTMAQHEEESIEAFETRLTTQAKKCKFTVSSVEIPAVPAIEDQPAIPAIPMRYKDISEEMIRDRIVVGIQNKNIQRRLLTEKDLTLRSAVDMLKVIETANQQAKTYLLLNQTPTGIDTLHKNRRKLRTQFIPTQKPQIRCYKQLNNPKTKLDKCGRCGGPQHSRSQCL